MARADKSNTGGMSLLAVMPFPALNPLNWGALMVPRNAMLASLNTTRLALDAWRAGADSMRAMMRLQQDEFLRMLETSAREEVSAGDGADVEAQAEADGAVSEEAEAAATLMMRPMIAATRAYGRVGRAFIVAQRDTLRAFAPAEKPH